MSLEHSLELVVGLVFLVFVLLLKDFVLLLCLDSVALDDVIVVVSALEFGLHLGQLVLNSVQLDTGIFSRLLDLADFFFPLAELEIDSLVLVRQLLGQGILQPRHQWL